MKPEVSKPEVSKPDFSSVRHRRRKKESIQAAPTLCEAVLWLGNSIRNEGNMTL